jgi:ubiquitin thioesterase OTU1
MKDDNSCLFRSIGYVINRDSEKSSKLRQEVADYVRQDPINYNDAILGRPQREYIDWILKPASWYAW